MKLLQSLCTLCWVSAVFFTNRKVEALFDQPRSYPHSCSYLQPHPCNLTNTTPTSTSSNSWSALSLSPLSLSHLSPTHIHTHEHASKHHLKEWRKRGEVWGVARESISRGRRAGEGEKNGEARKKSPQIMRIQLVCIYSGPPLNNFQRLKALEACFEAASLRWQEMYLEVPRTLLVMRLLGGLWFLLGAQRTISILFNFCLLEVNTKLLVIEIWNALRLQTVVEWCRW